MPSPRILMPALAPLGGAAWAAACGDGTTEPPAPVPPQPTPVPPRPTTVTVTPATAELTALGATVQLSAEVRDQNGNAMTGAAVTWSSGNASVATVDGAALATAAGNGTATNRGGCGRGIRRRDRDRGPTQSRKPGSRPASERRRSSLESCLLPRPHRNTAGKQR